MFSSHEVVQSQMEDVLKAVIGQQIKLSFVKEYQATATEEEGLGLLIAKYFKWDGLAILKTMYATLEDANFHTENKEVQKMIERVEALYVRP